MSESMVITIGKKGGEHIRIKNYYERNFQQHMEMIEDARSEIKRLPKTDKAIFSLAAGTAFAKSLFTAETAMAAGTSLSGAFEPVKDILLDIADPLCYIMFVWGCIECIVGRPASGLNRMKYAAIGYMAINWIPVLMDIIRSAGSPG